MRWFAVVALVVACKSDKPAELRRDVAAKPAVPASDYIESGSGSAKDFVAQPGVSAHAMAFAIDRVHERQSPSKTAPYHEPGGTWTYIEAHVAGDRGASFVVGLPPPVTSNGDPGFGKMWLVPTTADAGARVIAAFARQFEVPVPPRQHGGVLQPLEMPVALLGHDLGRDNGFSGTGTWDANKWFCSAGAVEEAEVFFNVSVATKQGELSEKDVDYSKDVATCLAIALRDGAPPPRTPDNDPTLSLVGPKLVRGPQLDPGMMEELALAPDRILMDRERPTGAAIVEVDPKTGAMKDLYRTADRIEYGHCDATWTRCVFRETKAPEGRNVFGRDPAKLLLLEGRTVTPLAVAGFGGKPRATRAPLSPDGTWIVAETYDKDTDHLVAWNRTTKQTVDIAPGKPFEVVDWQEDGKGWTAILAERSYDEKTAPQVRAWHLDGDRKVIASKAHVPDEVSPISPDGTRRADFTKDGKLVVTPLPSGTPRTMTLHPSDARHAGPGCCRWIDNRYLELLTGKQRGFIDTDTLKVSLWSDDDDDDDGRVAIGPLARYALVIGTHGTYLASLAMPK